MPLEALLLLGRDREHLDKGVGLPHDGEADNVQRSSELEEALDYAREVVCTTDRVTRRFDYCNIYATGRYRVPLLVR